MKINEGNQQDLEYSVALFIYMLYGNFVLVFSADTAMGIGLPH